MRGRHGHSCVSSVHELLAWDDLPTDPVHQGFETVGAAGGWAIIAHRKPLDPARRKKALSHDLVEIVQHLRAGRQFKHALVEAGLVLCPSAQLAGIDAVESRRLMQADK
jgi:hypothetical protein